MEVKDLELGLKIHSWNRWIPIQQSLNVHKLSIVLLLLNQLVHYSFATSSETKGGIQITRTFNTDDSLQKTTNRVHKIESTRHDACITAWGEHKLQIQQICQLKSVKRDTFIGWLRGAKDHDIEVPHVLLRWRRANPWRCTHDKKNKSRIDRTINMSNETRAVASDSRLHQNSQKKYLAKQQSGTWFAEEPLRLLHRSKFATD